MLRQERAGLCSNRWSLSSCLPPGLTLLQSSSKLPVSRVTLSVVSSQPAWSPDAWFHDADMHFRWMLDKSLLWILDGAFLSLWPLQHV